MVIALGLGVVAAVMFSISLLAAARAAREASAWQATLWFSTIAALAAAVIALTTGPFPGLGAIDWTWILIGGLGYGAGSFLYMLAVSNGKVSLVVPILACDGGIGALLAAAMGASISPSAAVFLCGMIFGVVLIVARDEPEPETEQLRFSSSERAPTLKTASLAFMAAVVFGSVFLATGEAKGMSPPWIAAATRSVSVITILIVVLAVEGIRLPPVGAWRWMVVAGVFDSLGLIAYIYGARHSVPVAAVSAAQYAALAVVGGGVAFHEALSRIQLIGIALLLVSTTALAATAAT